MNFMSGGDLRYQLHLQKKFSEKSTSYLINLEFIIACLVLALEALADLKVIHRDIKPENITLDAEGYARLTDFGIARFLRPENAADTSGTLGYMGTYNYSNNSNNSRVSRRDMKRFVCLGVRIY